MSEPSPRQQESGLEAIARAVARVSAGPFVNDAATRQALLEARAKILAKPRALHDASAAEDEMDVLVFLVGDERLSIPLVSIVSIVRATVVTPLPRAVAPVLGVASWRGRPITVLPVGAGISVKDAQRRLIVLGDGHRTILGLLVDAVDDARVVRKSALSPALGGARGRFAMGVTEDAVLVLDAEALFNAARPEP